VSREDIVAIASRLFAVFLALTAVRMAASGVGAMLTNHSGWDSLLYSLPVLLAYIVPAFLLWYFPVSIARKLLPAVRDTGKPIVAPGAEVQAIAFTVLGAWIVAEAISNATYWIALAQFMGTSEYHEISFTATQKASIARNIIEFVVGFALLVGSRGLSVALHRFRYGPSAAQAAAQQNDVR